jgi:pyrroline-5-carboxylate reductase
LAGAPNALLKPATGSPRPENRTPPSQVTGMLLEIVSTSAFERQSFALMEKTFRFLEGLSLGIFGPGHLGSAIARGLVRAGFPQCKLLICGRNLEQAKRELEKCNLGEVVTDGETLIRRSRMIFYLVRPQDFMAIANYAVRPDCLFVSFLAGIPLARLPVSVAQEQRVRVMTSAPDTLDEANGIAAMYPGDHPILREIFIALKIQGFPLRHESDLHAFTALGSCLPSALIYWEKLGNTVDVLELEGLGARFGLPDFPALLQWAQKISSQSRSPDEQEKYLDRAATPGGVTEAILTAIKHGNGLADALARGIQRSQDLASDLGNQSNCEERCSTT